MAEALQQGDETGMCGLYSLLNFLVREPKWFHWNDHRLTMRFLLDACAQYGWLNPATMIDGLEQHQLKKIMDTLIEDHRLLFQTAYTDDLIRATKLTKTDELIRRVVALKGSVLVHCNEREHWMMATGLDDDIVLLDSSCRGKPISLDATEDKLCPASGFAILPRKRTALGVLV